MTEPNLHPEVAQQTRPVDELNLYPGNARRGNVEDIADSLVRNGQYKPIIVNSPGDVVLVGNHTLQAARSLGWDRIGVQYVTVDEDRARAIVLRDNKASDDAGYDEAALLALLEDAPDLADTGFTGEELDQLIADVAPQEQPAPDDADELPAPAAETVTQPGDVWELGRHRLVCGDSTDHRTFDALMDGALADMIWTDPPYGVEYVGKTADALRIMNDGAAGLEGLLAAAFAAAARHSRPGAPIYVAHADTERVTFENTLRAAGFDVRQNLVWVKNTMVLGHSDYHWKHEPILYGELPWAEALAGLVPSGIHEEAHQPILYGFVGGGRGRLGRGGPRWFGEQNATTVFNFDKPPRNAEHPTMKPVSLIQAHMHNSLRPHGVVLDFFGGSGSTLVAAEYQGASARLIELDPRFCDVIVRRWVKATGGTPARNGTETTMEA